MPEHNYQYRSQQDLYTQMYEQYYFKQTQPIRVAPVKSVKKSKKIKKKNNFFQKLISFSFLFCLLGFILPFAFDNFIADIFPENTNNALNVDYKKLLYQTNSYL